MASNLSYLIVDDDADVLKAAVMALAGPALVVEALAAPEGLEARAPACDAVLLDMNFAAGARDGAEGFDGLARLRAADPALSVVLMTTYGGVKLAVEALKQGAVDFVLKPWRNEALAETMRAAAALTAERRAGSQLNLDAIERRAIERALALYEGNVSRAAAVLGLTRPALYRRMERHGL
ncbi:response regulator [uncultured Phenylobacterium sp.]|uniref:response regulator n=1 Tax=uncultured Phenylobacterium sp. TaxID=349273 RepID=UPI0025D27B2E|nr:response regulator [uncultured Phenylobacterium sp.]